ncbi:MAG TPA: coniferyl aldehyde dehydrogenase [Acetobacteraceae bacterium]|nr:coniferyl aldehyde dehydrogenase [Acetobacteraceae bacterium]
MDIGLGGIDPGAEARRLLTLQREAARRLPPPAAAQRTRQLQALEAMLRRHQAALLAAVSADFGTRSPPETALAEMMPLLTGARHARRHLARWMRPSRRHVGLTFQPGKAWVEYQPLGCVGIVAPWNYPILLSLAPLVDALAAGNRVLIKPSELTPATSGLIRRMIAETFPAEEVAVVEGDAAVARAFSALPFDHLLFTGSTAIGRQVMRAAADNLTPVTLELGGKSPALVAPDADPVETARIIAAGKFFSAGQTCIAADYVLAPASMAETLGDAIIAATRAFYPTLAGNPDYTAIISERHYRRLSALLEEAAGKGARVTQHDAPGDEASRKFPPTVVLNPPADCALMQEEIFGPILPVVGYESLDAAIAYVNARPRPLALYAFTRDRKTEREILAHTVSGGVTVNGTLLHVAQEDLPFGGIGPSGLGAYHGRDGFLRFSHARAVYRPGRFSGFMTLTPPHGRLTQMALRVLAGVRLRG